MKEAKARRQHRRRGNTLVEFAVSSGLLVALFTGTFQFGYAFYIYNNMITAVRDGARYASVAPMTKSSSSNSTPTAFRDAVRNMVVYGKASPTLTGSNVDSPLVPNLTVNNVDVVVTFQNVSGNYNPRQVQVRIINYNVDSVFRTFTFNGKPTLTMPYLGQYCANAC